MTQLASATTAKPGKKVDTASELSFPASDPSANAAPPRGVRFDPAPLRNTSGYSMEVQRLVIDGLQALFHLESTMKVWLPPMQAAIRSPGLRSCLGEMLGEVDAQLERLQRALAHYGVSHDDAHEQPHPPAMKGCFPAQPAGPLLDLAAALIARTEQHKILCAYEMLEPIAELAGPSDAALYIARCATSTHASIARIAQLCDTELSPSAVQGSSEPLPCEVIQLLFVGAKLKPSGSDEEAADTSCYGA
jgi:hypothetical protein